MCRISVTIFWLHAVHTHHPPRRTYISSHMFQSHALWRPLIIPCTTGEEKQVCRLASRKCACFRYMYHCSLMYAPANSVVVTRHLSNDYKSRPAICYSLHWQLPHARRGRKQACSRSVADGIQARVSHSCYDRLFVSLNLCVFKHELVSALLPTGRTLDCVSWFCLVSSPIQKDACFSCDSRVHSSW